jgi:hypothetical protein
MQKPRFPLVAFGGMFIAVLLVFTSIQRMTQPSQLHFKAQATASSYSFPVQGPCQGDPIVVPFSYTGSKIISQFSCDGQCDTPHYILYANGFGAQCALVPPDSRCYDKGEDEAIICSVPDSELHVGVMFGDDSSSSSSSSTSVYACSGLECQNGGDTVCQASGQTCATDNTDPSCIACTGGSSSMACTGQECTTGGTDVCATDNLTCSTTDTAPCFECVGGGSSSETGTSSSSSTSVYACSGLECQNGGDAVCQSTGQTCTIDNTDPSCISCTGGSSSDNGTDSSSPNIYPCNGFECAYGGTTVCQAKGQTCEEGQHESRLHRLHRGDRRPLPVLAMSVRAAVRRSVVPIPSPACPPHPIRASYASGIPLQSKPHPAVRSGAAGPNVHWVAMMSVPGRAVPNVCPTPRMMPVLSVLEGTPPQAIAPEISARLAGAGCAHPEISPAKIRGPIPVTNVPEGAPHSAGTVPWIPVRNVTMGRRIPTRLRTPVARTASGRAAVMQLRIAGNSAMTAPRPSASVLQRKAANGATAIRPAHTAG